MLTPYDYQEADINRIVNEPTRAAVIGSVVGTGKSLIGVEVIKRLNKDVSLIVAPPGTYDSWSKTVQSQMDVPLLPITTNTSEGKAAFVLISEGEPGVYFMGWELARRYIGLFKMVNVVVGDEVHRASNRKTKSAELWAFINKVIHSREGHTLALSATPWGNKDSGAWSVVQPMWPTVIPKSFWKWAENHVHITQESYNGQIVRLLGSEKVKGSIVKSLPLYIRHERDHRCCEFHPNGVQQDLPRRVFHDIVVDLTPAQRRIYNDLEQKMYAWIEEHDWPIDSDGFPMVNAMRMHQATLAVPTPVMVQRLKSNDIGEKELSDSLNIQYDLECKSSKIDAVLEILEDQPEGTKVLIFTHSSALIPALVHRINKKFKKNIAAAWYGSVSHANRQIIKDEFIEGNDVQIIVAQISAIAEGVDGLQRVCNTEIWVSTTDNMLHNTQAKGRLLRNGQKYDVQSYRIMARDTIEEKQIARLFERETNMSEGLKVR